MLDPHQQHLANGTDAHQDAAHLAAANALATQLVLAGVLRDDGEPMSGDWDVDNDIAAPSNILKDEAWRDYWTLPARQSLTRDYFHAYSRDAVAYSVSEEMQT